jgi:Restriction endonuclease AspBHI N-terminal
LAVRNAALVISRIQRRRRLVFGQKYWKPRENIADAEWNGFPNFWPTTDSLDGTHIRQSAGINPISRPKGTSRRPAVAIFLTPAGERHSLPWLDEVDLESGFIRYFGDNKPDLEKPAELAPGNRVLL